MTRTAVVVDPPAAVHHAATHYPTALAGCGVDSIAVTLPSARPHAQRTAPATRGYQQVIAHGDLTAALAELRGTSVCAVLPGTPAAVPAADRLAAELGVPGTGTPATSAHRSQPGLAAAALRDAGVDVPLTLETSTAAEASRWAARHRLRAAVVKPAATGSGIAPRQCLGTSGLVTAIRAARGAGHCVLIQEHIPGPRYVATTVTTPGTDGRPVHQVTAVWAELRTPGGQLERLDLLRPDATVTSTVGAHLHQVLDTLGITAGPARHQIVWSPHGPVVISCEPCPETAWQPAGSHRIPAGTDHVADTVRSLLAGDTPNPPSTALYVTRVVLAAPGPGLISPPLQRALLCLPTLAATAGHLAPEAPVTRTYDQTTSPGQLLLASDDPLAIAWDVETVRHLERSGLYTPTDLPRLAG